jgi:signal transduction histidine kinase/DNA-binding response OmpR family regulator
MSVAKRRFLVVEDEPAHAEAVRRSLVRHMADAHVVVTGSLAGMREAVAAQVPHLVLVDLNLPDGRALDVLHAPPESGEFPTVVMTSHGDEREAVEAMRAGALDYVVKTAESIEDMHHVVTRALRHWALLRERRSAQEQASRTARDWQRTFDAVRDAIWILDEKQVITRSNRAGEELLGPRDGSVTGRQCWDVLHGTPCPIPHCPLIRAQESLSRESLDITEGDRQFRVTVDPLLDERGAFAGAVHVVTDVTRQRQMHAAAAQSDRLASVGMLAAGLAHQINNPLSYVLCNLEALSQDLPLLDATRQALPGSVSPDKSSPPVEEMLTRVREAREGAERIKDVTRSLGTFSRVDAVELGPVDLRRVLESAASLAANEIRYRATLVQEIQDVAPVWAAEGHVAQLVLNLLLNAAHAVEEGNPGHHRVTLRLTRVGNEAVVEVGDTGGTYQDGELPRVFDPFFVPATRPVHVGLGLATSRSIATELGGRLDVRSRPGQGTVFTVRLPIMPDAATKPATQVLPATFTKPTRRKRILVVDDEAPIRTAIGRVLGRNYVVVQAGSGTAARDILLSDQAFDLILCDLMMPDMTGMDLHRWLTEAFPALSERVVFVTGGAFTPKAAEYLAGTRNHRVDKPFDASALKDLVDRLTDVTPGAAIPPPG